MAGCTLSAGGDADISLRLPAYFCAPSFAYLMVAGAYDAVTAVPGVRTVRAGTDRVVRTLAARGTPAVGAPACHGTCGGLA